MLRFVPGRRWVVLAAIGATALAAVPSAFPGMLPSAAVPQGPRVPGLPGFKEYFRPVPGQSPTTAQCAQAWNAQGPPLTRLWVAGQKMTKVHIGVAPTGMPSGPVCGVQFFLGANRVLLAQGPWTGDGVPRWQGGIQTYPNRLVSSLVRRMNGSVGSDGTVRCRLRCDWTATTT